MKTFFHNTIPFTSLLVFTVMSSSFASAQNEVPSGMVWIPPGKLTMGWDGPEGRFDERPAHSVHVDGFWIDATEVTNAQFRTFVEATDYITSAERPVDWEQLKKQLPPGTPKPPDEMLTPGSLVFTPPEHSLGLDDFSQWWTWTNGANWRHPKGPGSTIENMDNHPVVQISWDDAMAYASWAGKRLPTEAEWERAARRGNDGQRFIWGDELAPNGTHFANIWQGDFPVHNTAADGFTDTAPVRSFPPNSAGLYDMAGNVWEWTADQFHPDTYQLRLREIEPGGYCLNPTGPNSTADPRNPYSPDSRVQKGGSYLCHESYCSSYRPSAKMASTPDTGMSHLGFRCVKTPTSQTGDNAIKVATYNIKHGRGMDNTIDLERTAITLEAIDADIIALQEVDDQAHRSGGVDQAAWLAKRLGMHAAYGAFMNFQGGRYGLAILSRYPIQSHESWRLPNGNEPRVALAARIMTSSKDTITAIAVHFDWVSNDDFRYDQARETIRQLKALKTPWIVFGDFNDVPGSRTMVAFEQLGRNAIKPEDQAATFPADKPTIEIDYIISGPPSAWMPACAIVIPESRSSDHRPVMTKLLLIQN